MANPLAIEHAQLGQKQTNATLKCVHFQVNLCVCVRKYNTYIYIICMCVCMCAFVCVCICVGVCTSVMGIDLHNQEMLVCSIIQRKY